MLRMFCHFCGLDRMQDQKCFQELGNKLNYYNKLLDENRS